METLLRRIHASQKYPHVYRLSISVGKNQRAKARGALYIPTYEYNYKVITRCDTILQEYYITDRCNCENIKRYASMIVQRALTSYRRKTREMSRGPGGIGPQTVRR